MRPLWLMLESIDEVLLLWSFRFSLSPSKVARQVFTVYAIEEQVCFNHQAWLMVRSHPLLLFLPRPRELSINRNDHFP